MLSQKTRKVLNRKAAKYTKFKTRSRGIVQNRDTVLDKAAFSFAASRQMKIHQPLRFFPGDLCVMSNHAKAWERAVKMSFSWVAGIARLRIEKFFSFHLLLPRNQQNEQLSQPWTTDPHGR